MGEAVEIEFAGVEAARRADGKIEIALLARLTEGGPSAPVLNLLCSDEGAHALVDAVSPLLR